MKELASFNGAVTAAIHSLGLNSRKVLNAVNAWVGSLEVSDSPESKDKVDITAKAKLSGKVTAKGDDKRVITIVESEKRKVVRKHTWQGALYALSTACDELVERHGITLEISTFSPEIESALSRDSFRDKASAPVAAPVADADDGTVMTTKADHTEIQ